MAEGLGIGFSQPGVTQAQDTFVAAGTLLAAALENSGYFAQELVLDQFISVLNGVAALIYLGSFLGAVITISLSGEYKSGIWFFIGPVLFYFTTLTRVEASATNWAFGVFKDDRNLVDIVKRGTPDKTANVSWLFHRYNLLVSNVVQNTIRAVTNNSVKRQLLFMTRSRVMERMMTAEVENQDLLNLVAFGITGQCAEEMDAARTVALANRYGKEALPGMKTPLRAQASIYNAALVKHADFGKKNVSFNHDKSVIPYITKTLDYFRNGPIDQEARNKLVGALCIEPGETQRGADYFLYPEGVKTGVTQQTASNIITNSGANCAQIWCWTALGFAKEARETTGATLEKLVDPKLVDTYIDDPERSKIYKNIYEEILAHIAIKLQKPMEFESHVGYEDADKSGDAGQAARAKVGPGRIVDKEKRREDLSLIPVMTAGILLRNALKDDTRSRMITQLGKHIGIYNKPYNISSHVSTAETMDIARLGNEHSMAQGFQYEAFSLAASLPYLQGIMLFALAMLFPFFAILLVIPGKAQAFLSWFAFWTWLKCWDVGWAFVMVVDDMLWNMMPHSSWFNIHTDANHGPLTILEAAFQYDYSYSLANYYLLIASVLFFVPIVSAQAVLGAKQAVGGILLQAGRGLAQGYGGAAADYIAIGNTQDSNYIREMAQLGEVFDKAIVKQTPASDELAALKKNEQAAMKSADSHHNWGKGIGTLGAVGLGIAAVALVALGGALLAGAAIGLGAFLLVGAVAGISGLVMNQGQNTSRNAVGLKRASHSRRAAFNDINAKTWHQKTNYNHMAWTGTRLRQAWSRRGQHWTVTEAYVDGAGAIAQLNAKREAAEAFAKGSFWGAATTNATGAVETWVTRGSRR